MKIKVLAVGTKMPSWVQEGAMDYLKRMPRDMSTEFVEIAAGNRQKGADIGRAIKQESDQILSSVNKADHVVALEVKGKPWSTEQLANNLLDWKMSGQNLVFLIGGPDGLSDACRDRANQLWSLSALTLPHPIVRVVLAEQLYRAWTITQNHPYHRA